MIKNMFPCYIDCYLVASSAKTNARCSGNFLFFHLQPPKKATRPLSEAHHIIRSDGTPSWTVFITLQRWKMKETLNGMQNRFLRWGVPLILVFIYSHEYLTIPMAEPQFEYIYQRMRDKGNEQMKMNDDLFKMISRAAGYCSTQ